MLTYQVKAPSGTVLAEFETPEFVEQLKIVPKEVLYQIEYQDNTLPGASWLPLGAPKSLGSCLADMTSEISIDVAKGRLGRYTHRIVEVS